jgi:hypothetical protein
MTISFLFNIQKLNAFKLNNKREFYHLYNTKSNSRDFGVLVNDPPSTELFDLNTIDSRKLGSSLENSPALVLNVTLYIVF